MQGGMYASERGVMCFQLTVGRGCQEDTISANSVELAVVRLVGGVDAIGLRGVMAVRLGFEQ